MSMSMSMSTFMSVSMHVHIHVYVSVFDASVFLSKIPTWNKISDELLRVQLDAQILRNHRPLPCHRALAYAQTIDRQGQVRACFLPNQEQQGLNVVLKLFEVSLSPCCIVEYPRAFASPQREVGLRICCDDFVPLDRRQTIVLNNQRGFCFWRDSLTLLVFRKHLSSVTTAWFFD